jgi:uncharacterized membrane protein
MQHQIPWGALAASAIATAWLAWPQADPAPVSRILYVEPAPGTLPRVLAAHGLAVTETTELPPRLADYDVVILADMPAHRLDARALDAYVIGGGHLVVTGGADSLGSGGYEATALERLLPTYFRGGCRSGTPELALAIIVDGSDESKRAARDLVESLSPNDFVTVIGAVAPQRAAHRKRIADGIANAHAVELTAALHEAGNALDGIYALRKHVVTLTAGPGAYALELADRGITQSTQAPLDDIAAVLRAAVADDELVHVRGLAAPPLHGYVEMRAKATAETLLSTTTGDPLLARWRRGTGTVTAWTSDADGAWAQDWTTWPGYAAFWVAIASPSS